VLILARNIINVVGHPAAQDTYPRTFANSTNFSQPQHPPMTTSESTMPAKQEKQELLSDGDIKQIVGTALIP
jgi:hypothetical protein